MGKLETTHVLKNEHHCATCSMKVGEHKMHIRAIFGAVALAAIASNVSAQTYGYGYRQPARPAPPTSYSTIGNTTYGSNGSTATTIGNTTYRSNGVTSTSIGNTTYHSNGTSSTTVGNTTYGTNGTTATTVGNTTYINGPNGARRTCTNIGTTTYCN